MSEQTEHVDRLYLSCKELVTLTAGPETGARRGAALGDLGVIEDGAVAVRNGRIVAIGPTSEITARFQATDEVDTMYRTDVRPV